MDSPLPRFIIGPTPIGPISQNSASHSIMNEGCKINIQLFFAIEKVSAWLNSVIYSVSIMYVLVTVYGWFRD